MNGIPEPPIDPPDPTHEEDICRRCKRETAVSMRSRLCDDCEEDLYDQAQEAKFDEAKDEGRLRRF